MEGQMTKNFDRNMENNMNSLCRYAKRYEIYKVVQNSTKRASNL